MTQHPWDRCPHVLCHIHAECRNHVLSGGREPCMAGAPPQVIDLDPRRPDDQLILARELADEMPFSEIELRRQDKLALWAALVLLWLADAGALAVNGLCRVNWYVVGALCYTIMCWMAGAAIVWLFIR